MYLLTSSTELLFKIKSFLLVALLVGAELRQQQQYVRSITGFRSKPGGVGVGSDIHAVAMAADAALQRTRDPFVKPCGATLNAISEAHGFVGNKKMEVLVAEAIVQRRARRVAHQKETFMDDQTFQTHNVIEPCATNPSLQESTKRIDEWMEVLEIDPGFSAMSKLGGQHGRALHANPNSPQYTTRVARQIDRVMGGPRVRGKRIGERAEAIINNPNFELRGYGFGERMDPNKITPPPARHDVICIRMNARSKVPCRRLPHCTLVEQSVRRKTVVLLDRILKMTLPTHLDKTTCGKSAHVRNHPIDTDDSADDSTAYKLEEGRQLFAPCLQRSLQAGNEQESALTSLGKRAAMRMCVNGETRECMEHVRAIKAAGGVSLSQRDGNDTSRDQQWAQDTTQTAVRADKYVLYTTILWLGIKIPIMAVPMLICTFLPFLVARAYISTFAPGTERVKRNAAFYSAFLLALSFASPAIVLVSASLLFDYMAYYFFCLLYCAFTHRWSRLSVNWAKIKPYTNGPWIITHAPDLFVALMGQCARHGLGVTWYMGSCMLVLIPWLKYYVNCNPWIYDLDHRLCQQISTSMKDLGPHVADSSRVIISRAKQSENQWKRLDRWSFVPHYPYPPQGRRWALGMQCGGGDYPGRFTLIVHTTHAIAEAQGFTRDDQFVLSNSCDESIYRVMLWYSNPFHFLTGWVEASISNGRPSQYPEKYHGGEHPMWLVTGRTPLLAARDSWTGSGMIDAFFDYWLPAFVHEMRYSTFMRLNEERGDTDKEADLKAKNYADNNYQEVDSADGVSKAINRVGIDRYRNGSTMRVYETVGEHTLNKVQREAGKFTNKVSQTQLGQALFWMQSRNETQD